MNKRFVERALAALVLALFGVAGGPAVLAHEVRPAYLQIQETAPDVFSVVWKQPAMGELALHLEPSVSNGLLQMASAQQSTSNSFIVLRWEGLHKSRDSFDGATIAVDGLQQSITDALVSVSFLNGQDVQTILRPTQPAAVIHLTGAGKLPVLDYLRLGVEHILTGFDHLSFVLGLVLLIRGRALLLKTITAFTLAHSITLAAAATGYLHPDPPVIEALVALSIVFVALELVRAWEGHEGLTVQRPWLIAFTFGLLHGFAFAGSLADIGLPPHHVPLALFLFNCGVEIGQLLFVGAVLLVMAGLRWVPEQRRLQLRLAVPYAIGTLSTYWMLQRLGVLIHRAVGSTLFAVSATVLAIVAASAPASAADKAPSDRQAWFGDLHLHTSYSFDAYVLFGAKVDPDGAYRFARGETVQYAGDSIHRSTPPLDFMAVTDHSENIGVFTTLEDPNSPLAKSEIGQDIKKNGAKAFARLMQLTTSGLATRPLPGVDEKATSRSAWQHEVDFANQNYQPGKFTTFIAYEWTSMPDGQNLHRNVIFRGNSAPNPFSSADSSKPEDLWAWLDTIRGQGYEALAIPHNSNASNGLMFDWVDSQGKPIDQAYAEERASNEPLAEISQNKGASETLPELSPNDEFANFERYDHLLVSPSAKSKPGGSYVRDALGRGLIIASNAGGVNPFKYGIVGASDYHTGLSDSGEGAYAGGMGPTDPSKPPPDPTQYLQTLKDITAGMAPVTKVSPDKANVSLLYSYYEVGSGNLTGVWAEENTRESIYDALRRKETFATSGTRLKARFFGGWHLQADPTRDRDWVRKAYAGGVPQGGDLPSQGSGAPQFALWAAKDPNGANLDRIQVIKLAARDGKYIERIYDVAVSDHRKIDPVTHRAPALPNTVDLKTAQYTNTVGAAELATTWRDPEFDAGLPTVYYVRVLEINTPRWSTIVAVKRGIEPPAGFPPTTQERAWTSPIWYTPQKQ